jgi:hypothetical protein
VVYPCKMSSDADDVSKAASNRSGASAPVSGAPVIPESVAESFRLAIRSDPAVGPDNEANGSQYDVNPGAVRGRTGRKVSDAWAYLTDCSKPHTLISVECKHCRQTVATRKKSERAVNHLNSCFRFKRLMKDVVVTPGPWIDKAYGLV